MLRNPAWLMHDRYDVKTNISNITLSVLVFLLLCVGRCSDKNEEIDEYGLTPDFVSKFEYHYSGGYDVLTDGMIIGYFSRISFDNYLENYKMIYHEDTTLYQIDDTRKVSDNSIDTLKSVFEQTGYFLFPYSLPVLTDSSRRYTPASTEFYAYRKNITDTLKILLVDNGIVNSYFPEEYRAFRTLFNNVWAKIEDSVP